ncbi:hypothetical protein FA396_24090 [Pseudomonas aeruginosa]|nr:hypothetical protein [Pseudomonas aeruginosa]
MLGKQLHPFVPAHRVRQNTHTTPLRRPTLSCTTVARLPLRYRVAGSLTSRISRVSRRSQTRCCWSRRKRCAPGVL